MSGAHATPHPRLQHHFDNLEQQFEASALGMWLFLVTEILFFGGLFLAYLVYRLSYPRAFAEASHELDVVLGGVNTAVLIGSSLTMAMAVWAAQLGRRGKQLLFLGLTIGLGLVFLGIKAVEYSHKFEHDLVPGANFHFESAHDPVHAQLFFSLYFVMTGLHARAHGRGHRPHGGAVRDGLQGPVHQGVPHAGRGQRPLLALRRHRLDLPVPAALPDRPARAGGALGDGTRDSGFGRNANYAAARRPRGVPRSERSNGSGERVPRSGTAARYDPRAPLTGGDC